MTISYLCLEKEITQQEEPVDLLLVRHGETEENLAGICQGQTSGSLSPLGERQARQLGTALRDYPIDLCYCSDLGRAQHTCRLLYGALQSDPPIVWEPRLRERYFGSYEGSRFITFDGVDESSEVETIEAISERLKDLLAELPAKRGGCVMLLSHGFTLRVLRSLLLRGDCSGVESGAIMHNAGYSLYRYDSTRLRWREEIFDHTSHLY